MSNKKELFSPEEIKERGDEFSKKHGTDPNKWPKYENLVKASSETSFQVKSDTFKQSCSIDIAYSFFIVQAPVPLAFLTLKFTSENDDKEWVFNGTAVNLHASGEISGLGTIYYGDPVLLQQQTEFTVDFDKINNTIKVGWGSAGYATANITPLYNEPIAGSGKWTDS